MSARSLSRTFSSCLLRVFMINFNRIDEDIFVGSTPRNMVDIGRLHKQLKVTAVLSLQTDADFKNYQIDFSQLLQGYEAANIRLERFPITDFDADDMGKKLVEPVQKLAELIGQGYRVYVHCNAGICRAPGTVLGYLHVYRGMPLEEGLAYLREKRPMVNPYMDAVRQAMTAFPESS